MLVKISCCYDLAYRNAGNFPIELPDNIRLDKGQRVKHYLAVAKGLENQYSEMKNDLGQVDENGEATGNPKMQVVELTRKTYFTDTSRVGTNRYGT